MLIAIDRITVTDLNNGKVRLFIHVQSLRDIIYVTFFFFFKCWYKLYK